MAVCKEIFKSVFSVTNGRLGRLLKSYDKDPNELPKDKRGPKENQRIDNKVCVSLWKIKICA